MKITEIDINALFLCQGSIKRKQLVSLLNTYSSVSGSSFHTHANKLIRQGWLEKILLGYYTLYHTRALPSEKYLHRLATTKNGIRILKSSKKLLDVEKKKIEKYLERKKVKREENVFQICYSLGCFYPETLNIESQIKPLRSLLDNSYTYRVYKNEINSIIKTSINRLKRRNIDSWAKVRPYFERKLDVVEQSIDKINQILITPRLAPIVKRIITST
ncbi:hypothetical protein ES702_07448 [subsurface metagenome]